MPPEGLGPALVHPEKPLKHPRLELRRDADARIFDRYNGLLLLSDDGDLHRAILHIIFDVSPYSEVHKPESAILVTFP